MFLFYLILYFKPYILIVCIYCFIKKLFIIYFNYLLQKDWLLIEKQSFIKLVAKLFSIFGKIYLQIV
jgi:hypothetical protein